MAFQDTPITPHPVVKPEYDDLFARFGQVSNAVTPFAPFTGSTSSPQTVVPGTVYFAKGRAFKRRGVAPVSVTAMDPADTANWTLVAGSIAQYVSQGQFPAVGDYNTIYVDKSDFTIYMWDGTVYARINQFPMYTDVDNYQLDGPYNTGAAIQLSTAYRFFPLGGSAGGFSGNYSNYVGSGRIFINNQANTYDFQIDNDLGINNIVVGTYFFVRQGVSGGTVAIRTVGSSGTPPVLKSVGCNPVVQFGQTLLCHHTAANEWTLYPAFGTVPTNLPTSSGGGSAVLYASTGQNTDGAMTQKATTDALGAKADLVNGVVPLTELPYKQGTNISIATDGTISAASPVLYGSTGQATDGAMTQKAASDELALRAPIASPTLTGTPAAPTPALSDSSTQIATTAFVNGVMPKLYTSTGQNTNGAMTQKATTDELALTVHLAGTETISGDKTFNGTNNYTGYNNFTGYVSVPDVFGGADGGSNQVACTAYVARLGGRFKTLAYSTLMKRNDLTLRNNITYYLTADYTTGGPGTSQSLLFSAGSWTPLPTIPTVTPNNIQSSVKSGTFVSGVMTTVPTGSLPGMKFFDTNYVYEHMRNDDTSTNTNSYVWVRVTKG